MIQRQHLSRTLHHLQHPPPSSTTCLVCTCHCGSSFHPSSPQHPLHHQQRRQYARRAPSTIDRSYARKLGPLSPSQFADRNSRKKFHNEWFSREVDYMSRTGTIPSTPESTMQFLADFTSAMDKSRGQSSVEPKVLIGILNQHFLGFSTADVLSRVLLRDSVPENLYMGKKLLYSLSRAGYVESTIRIMTHAMLGAKRKPGVLRSRELAFAREHLTRVAVGRGLEAGAGKNFRAMVLEGKIALHLGKEEYAIEMLNQAMDAAVEAGEMQLANGTVQKEGVKEDELELTAPWHELMQVHWYRSTVKGLDEMGLCEAAMEIGCQQDDPTAHKFKADYVRRWEGNPDDGGEQDDQVVHIGTSDWLYHITKAAASGVPQAAHELGVFYAESGWKYIEDEPPDHIKPTPFDSYPSSQLRITTFWNNILHSAGLKNKPITPQERMFHTALFPHTAVDRLKLAIGWLEQAMGYNYAPSYLMMARLYNRKTLWAQADAPKEVLGMKNSRYTYSSKQSFERAHPISPSSASASSSSSSSPSSSSSSSSLFQREKKDPPNPFHDPQKSQLYLGEIFDAHEAFLHESRRKTQYAKDRVEGTEAKYPDADDALAEQTMLKYGGLPPKLGKWFKFPEVRELNGEVIQGLWEEAKEMCEEEGWVLVNEVGGLVYKSRLGGKGRS